MIQVSKYTTGTVQTNVYFAFRPDTGKAVIIDPAANAARIIEICEKTLKLQPEAILLTHGHFDHIMAAKEVAEHFGIRIYACEEERELLANAEWNLSGSFQTAVTITDFVPVKDGDRLTLLGADWQVLGTPGHTGGSVCYYIGASEAAGETPLLFSGDTLFQESFGRTDFPTGSEKALLKSITEKLLVLPEETAVYPGHEGQSTIAHERMYNPAVYLTQMP